MSLVTKDMEMAEELNDFSTLIFIGNPITMRSLGKPGGRRVNGHKLKNGKFHVNVSKRFFTEKGVILWNKFPREVVESPSLELFRSRLNRFLSILL